MKAFQKEPDAIQPPGTPILTLTGADEHTDVSQLAGLDAEIGFLFAASHQGNRHPRWEWIREASLEMRRAALHVCGKPAREQLFHGTLAVGSFQRIQVNGVVTPSELIHFCAMFPRHTIITQHHPRNAELAEVRLGNHAILIDASGGRGISPTEWAAPKTNKAVGFAGGLGPENLEKEMGKIWKIARKGWWVDMENKLRVDDWFSIELAQACVTEFKKSA